MTDEQTPRPPARLRALVSWQAGRVATVAARLTTTRMPLQARAEFAVLAALEEYGPVSQAELGRRLALDRNNVTEVLDRLEERALVHRGPDPTDRRRNTVGVTDDGRRYLDELQTATDAVQAELTAPLTDREAATLRDLLAKVLGAHPGLPS